MTICVAVKVHDCLVFAADSATSLIGIGPDAQPTIVNVYAHGNKVFNLVKGQPIVAMTCGAGNIGRSSISSLAKELRRRLSETPEQGGLDPASYSIEEVADRARQFLFEESFLQQSPTPSDVTSLEFWIGGYGADREDAELWKIVIENGQCPAPQEQMPEQDSFVVWSGQPEALNRLLLGFSGGVIEALAAGGLEQDRLGAVHDLITTYTATPLVSAPMPIGDAIALADFLVDVTKKYVHFRDGADTVGGDTDIATVTRYEGFKWIKRKHFYPKHLNLETDHV